MDIEKLVLLQVKALLLIVSKTESSYTRFIDAIEEEFEYLKHPDEETSGYIPRSVKFLDGIMLAYEQSETNSVAYGATAMLRNLIVSLYCQE